MLLNSLSTVLLRLILLQTSFSVRLPDKEDTQAVTPVPRRRDTVDVALFSVSDHIQEDVSSDGSASRSVTNSKQARSSLISVETSQGHFMPVASRGVSPCSMPRRFAAAPVQMARNSLNRRGVPTSENTSGRMAFILNGGVTKESTRSEEGYLWRKLIFHPKYDFEGLIDQNERCHACVVEFEKVPQGVRSALLETILAELNLHLETASMGNYNPSGWKRALEWAYEATDESKTPKATTRMSRSCLQALLDTWELCVIRARRMTHARCLMADRRSFQEALRLADPDDQRVVRWYRQGFPPSSHPYLPQLHEHWPKSPLRKGPAQHTASIKHRQEQPHSRHGTHDPALVNDEEHKPLLREEPRNERSDGPNATTGAHLDSARRPGQHPAQHALETEHPPRQPDRPSSAGERGRHHAERRGRVWDKFGPNVVGGVTGGVVGLAGAGAMGGLAAHYAKQAAASAQSSADAAWVLAQKGGNGTQAQGSGSGSAGNATGNAGGGQNGGKASPPPPSAPGGGGR